ncbi:muscleblind protein 3-like [Tropilaelaps mercedesae]|uniref:Muscleblind protein 3-like n=1 Tax=Tropilaelaps mercedesae TaxID=418985 RepID=A0A1V9XJW6_9ACAR|nr:muscleblind protein 3-like [Tropilaelaps mercedesae]
MTSFTLQASLPGMVQYKRPALEKSGLPVYQPTATAAAAAAYQQAALALQMQQQFAVPVSYFVEVTEGRVAVCRDAAKGKCVRPLCKYYHIPLMVLQSLQAP